MAFLTRVKLPSNSEYDLKGTLQTVKGTQTSNTAAWTGALNVTELTSGTTIAYYLPRTSAANVTLKLTLRDGTETAAVPVYFQGSTRLGTEYPAGSIVFMTYYAAGDISVGGTATSDNRWVVNSYNASQNTDTKVTQTKTTSQTGAFDILISASASGTATKTEGALKDSDFNYNPSTNTLTVPNAAITAITATTINGVTVGANPEFTDTTYANGTGITIGSGNAINHSNSVTAKTTQAVYPIKFDAQGHITGAGTAVTIGAAAAKGVDTSISDSNKTSTNLPVTSAVYDFVVSKIGKPMRYMGTVGSAGDNPTITWGELPTAAESNAGETYKVISASSTGIIADVGDTIISNGTVWTVIPSGDEPEGTVTSVAVGTSNGGVIVTTELPSPGTAGDPITSSGTIKVGHADTSSASNITAATGKFVNAVTLDDYGHVTAISTNSTAIKTTDENVLQKLVSTNEAYPILFAGNKTLSTTGVTTTTGADNDLKYNPSTNNLTVSKINGVTVGSIPKFTDTIIDTDVTYSKSNGTGTLVQSKTVNGGPATNTNIFTTTDYTTTKINSYTEGTTPSLGTPSTQTVAKISSWAAGDYPVTFSVDSEMLTIANGTKPSLGYTNNTSVVSGYPNWSAGSVTKITKEDHTTSLVAVASS